MPVPDPYTHKFKYYIGDGGKFIEGECEFNQDKKSNFKIDTWSIPLEKETLKHFQELMNLLEEIFVTHDGIKLIRIKKIES